MGAKFLVDTNTIIELVTQLLPPAGGAWVDGLVLREEHAISVINWIELLVNPRSAQEKQVLELFVATSPVLPLDADVVRQTILLRQQYHTKLPDAIVAATALVHGLVLVSRNTSDFSRIAGLVVVNPHHIL
ncbi:type II toxin-antitoxin system VapC family toxin [Hymenobacter saemangeumensis]|uniref:Type II toxin-antitoxin system VapC family toxin n=1 Tax=Hymenobacter saemangeumensis TaxID=1084522 RepID=A0ABP8HZW3_9BACT